MKKEIYYPKQNIMKKNRFIKMRQLRGKCEVCNKIASHIHHIDEDRSNHDMSNLALVCIKCHNTLHTGRQNTTSLFIREYGVPAKHLSKILDLGEGSVYALHKSGKLKEILKKRK